MNDTAEKLEEKIEDTAEVVENDEKFDIEIVDDTPDNQEIESFIHACLCSASSILCGSFYSSI